MAHANPDGTNAEELRGLIAEDDEILVVPGAFDAMTAGIVESLGYDAVYMGGWATGAATGATEPMATMTEMCDRAREVTRSVDVPLVVDGNAGFGNPSHTYRAVREYAKSGIAGMHIEDQVYPKRLHYHAGRHHVIEPGEMATKVEAAVQAREEMAEDIVLIARTDANRGNRRDEETVEDVVERVDAYLDAGAEVGMAFPETEEEAAYVAEHADGPMMYVLTEERDPGLTPADLEAMGYAAVIYPISATAAAARAVRGIYEDLAESGTTGIDPGAFAETTDRIKEVIDLPRFYGIEEEAGKK